MLGWYREDVVQDKRLPASCSPRVLLVIGKVRSGSAELPSWRWCFFFNSAFTFRSVQRRQWGTALQPNRTGNCHAYALTTREAQPQRPQHIALFKPSRLALISPSSSCVNAWQNSSPVLLFSTRYIVHITHLYPCSFYCSR